MIRVRLSQKIYFVVAFILLASLCLWFVLSNLLRILTLPSTRDEGRLPFYARLLEEFSPHDPLKGMQKIHSLQGAERLLLLDAQGNVVFPEGAKVPFAWDEIKKPQKEFEVARTDDLSIFWPKPPPPILIRLPGEPTYYLAAIQRTLRSSPQFIYSTFAVLVICILVGIALALIFLNHFLKKKVVLADSVLEEMRSGNLKARFHIRTMDEIGRAMSRFNTMADEVERLVEQISQADKSRMKLLQELAHDLRTPVASLKNLLETLRSDQLPKPLREEMKDLAMKEVDYFERLVEDLLTLAQVTEPRFVPGHDRISLGDFVEDEAEQRWGKRSGNPALRLSQEIDPRPLVVNGDAHLLRRMLRNALDNALSFARSEVHVQVQPLGAHEALILIDDDGPGFSEDALASFGHRRISRRQEDEKHGRLSVGLGSVIMKNIAQLHRGSIEIGNRMQGDQILGGQVRIRLPLETVS